MFPFFPPGLCNCHKFYVYIYHNTQTTFLAFYIYPQIYYFWHPLFLCKKGLLKSKEMSKKVCKTLFFCLPLPFSFSSKSRVPPPSPGRCSPRASPGPAGLGCALCSEVPSVCPSVCPSVSTVAPPDHRDAPSHAQLQSPWLELLTHSSDAHFRNIFLFQLTSPAPPAPCREV